MRVLQLGRWSVATTERGGFKFREVEYGVQTEVSQVVVDVEDPDTPFDIGAEYYFRDRASIDVWIAFETPDDEESSSHDGYSSDEEDDSSADIDEMASTASPSVWRHATLVVTPADDEALSLVIAHLECFEITIEVTHFEIDVETIYPAMEQTETAHAAEILKGQTAEEIADIVQDELGFEPELPALRAPVKIQSVESESDKVSSVNDDDPLYCWATLADGTTILAEYFRQEGIPHRRPIQLRIPLKTLLGENLKVLAGANQGKAAEPLCILSGWGKSGQLSIDDDYDPDGQYEWGHLMPSAAGAPYNSYIVVPMLQYINQAGPWRQLERKLSRYFYGIGVHKNAMPIGAEEQDVAAIMNSNVKTDDTSWNCYLRIRVRYGDEDDDPRIPVELEAALHRVKDSMQIVLLAQIEHTEEAVAAGEIGSLMSPALAKVFAEADRRLATADALLKREWEPLDRQNGLTAPGIPEPCVPRPYRALDFLILNEELFAMAINDLTKDPDSAVLLNAVRKATVGRGYGFNSSQRHLAILYNKWKNKDRLLSDLRQGAARVDKSIETFYTDPIGDQELGAWSGDNQAQADHHVPKSTGSGYNLFTNLLYISRKQNLGGITQNKSLALTNPLRHNKFGSGSTVLASSSTAVKRSKEKTAEKTVTRSLTSVAVLTRKRVVVFLGDRWRREGISMDEALIAVAGEYWTSWFLNENAPLPWTEEAKMANASARRMLVK